MKQFNSIWKFIVGGGTVLGYQAFYARMTDRNSTELKESINSVSVKLDDMADKLSGQNKEISEAKASLQNLINIQEKYYEKHSKIAENDTVSSNSLFNEYAEEITKAFNKCKEVTEKVNNNYNDVTNNFSENNIFKELINDFNNYLSSLSTTEICLVINITSSLFILTCLVTIIFAVYGNYLISKMNLEKNYPRFATFISIRVKLQHTYVITNVMFILFTIAAMITINIITLINF